LVNGLHQLVNFSLSLVSAPASASLRGLFLDCILRRCKVSWWIHRCLDDNSIRWSTCSLSPTSWIEFLCLWFSQVCHLELMPILLYISVPSLSESASHLLTFSPFGWWSSLSFKSKSWHRSIYAAWGQDVDVVFFHQVWMGTFESLILIFINLIIALDHCTSIILFV